MKRVVIVEDEKLVLMGIVSLFEGQHDYAIIGSFTNPIKALQIIGTELPDIVITDIKMPQLDGLSLIGEIKKLDAEIHIVVISCYDDFNTVSHAFRLGINDYLLKHEIERASLFSILDGIPVHHQSIPAQSMKNSQSIVEYLKRPRLSSDFPEGVYLAMIVFKKLYSETFEPLGSSINIYWCQQLVQTLLDSSGLGKVCSFKNNDLVCVLDGREALSAKRGEFFIELQKQFSNYINRPVIILKSPIANISEIDESWLGLLKKRSCIYYIQKSGLYSITSSQCSIKNSSISLPDPLLLFSIDNKNDWNEAMKIEIENIKRDHLDPSVLCLDLLLYWHEVEKIATRLIGEVDLSLSIGASVYERIQAYDSVTILFKWFVSSLELLQERLISYTGQRRSVVRMKIFLHTHYQEHISLSTLAERFHLHENYVSEIFKKDAGVGYLEYLHDVRVEESKSLLRKSNKTAEEIALLVGFTNASHFSKVFKKTTGMTITEFKNSQICAE